MAQTVTDDFKAVWKHKGGKVALLQVRYKRHYWNGAACVWESAWTTLAQNEFSDVGDVVANLDTTEQNVFKWSNLTIRLNNLRGKWFPGAYAPSVFAPDGTATLGYIPKRTLFDVRFAYKLPDASFEYVTMFTGYADDFQAMERGAIMEVTLISKSASLLQGVPASDVSDTVTLENCVPATGDGTNADFVTGSGGVSFVDDVQVNGVSKVPGADEDYTVGNLDQPTGATITFNAGREPGAGDTVKWSGRKWKANQTIETLVGLLCDTAGITAGERTIAPVLFAGPLSGYKQIDTQAQWEAGTVLANIDTQRVAGSITWWKIIDDFRDNAYEAPRSETCLPAWTAPYSQGSNYYGVSGNELVVGLSGLASWFALQASISTISSDVGTYHIKAGVYGACDPTLAGPGDGIVALFCGTAALSLGGGGPLLTGYGIRWCVNRGAGADGVQLMRFDGQIATEGTLLANIETTLLGGVADYDVTRDGAGNMSVYKNGVLLCSATDATYNSFSVFAFVGETLDVHSALDMHFGNLWYSPQTSLASAAVYESAEFDLLVAPTAWGLFFKYETLNGGSVVYKTATADIAGGPYEAWTTVTAAGVQASSLKRYYKFRIEISLSSDRISPSVDRVRGYFQTTTVILTVAVFTGLTCYQAIEKLAKLCGYEFGSKADGTFFFRPRDPTASSVATLDQESAISEITDWRPGYDKIVNVGQVKYNEYFTEYDGTDAGEASPTSEQKYGRIAKYEDLSDILVANDLDLASARAQTIYENSYLPKRRMRLTCKILPWLELGDVVTVTFYDHPLQRGATWGDPLAKWDAWWFSAGPSGTVLAQALQCKVIGLTLRPADCTMDLTVEEVLS